MVKAIKRVMRYLSGTEEYGLEYRYGHHGGVEGYVDASYAGDKHKRRSVSGYVIMVNGSALDWKSRLQSITAQSTMESE